MKTKLNPGDIVIAPELCNYYLTPHKEYEIKSLWGDSGEGFEIYSDKGTILCCKLNRCAHLKNHSWTIKYKSK